MSRYDAVNYISHRIAKVPGQGGQAGAVSGADEDAREENVVREGPAALEAYCVNLNAKANAGRIDPLIGRDAEVERTIQVLCRRTKNNPLYVGDAGVGKTRARRGAGAADRERRGAAGAGRRGDLRARHGRAARRHPLPRRLRGAHQGGPRRDRGPRGRDPLHRRDPHRHRRGRHERRRDGRLQPAEARVAERHAALHRLDHLQGIPQLLREGPRAGPALPEDRRERAEPRRGGQDPARAQALLRGAPRRPLHGRSDPHRRRAGEPLHHGPETPRQGHRRDRRGRRLAAPAAGIEAAQDRGREGRRGRGGEDRAHPAQEREPRRQDHPGEPGARPEDRRLRPGRGDRRRGDRDQDGARADCASPASRSAATSSRAPPGSARRRSPASSPT